MRRRTKKVIMIVLISIVVVILLMVSLYFYGLTSVSKNSETVTFTINKGESTKDIINDLQEAKLIKSKLAASVYVMLHRDLIMQAGTYELDRSDDTKEIFNKLNRGHVVDNTITVTFIEGKRITDYIKTISDKFGISESAILEKLKDEEYLKSLIEEYDFLDESILNKDLYYSLEGYLFPATYTFYKNATIEEILAKMLAKTQNVLDNYSTAIKESGFTTHEILTMASIIENETMIADDRSIVSQVIHKRLNVNMSLGMDVTAYYGVKKDLKETLTSSDLSNENAYNTRRTSFLGLPVGPISNPSEASIVSALNPSNTDYLYFYADKEGKLHFAKNNAEFEEIIRLYS